MEFKGNITANLPAIDFTETEKFYHFLGFSTIFRSHEWTILKLGEMLLELFHHPELDAQNSWHSACIRVENIEDYFDYWSKLNWSLFPRAKMTEIKQLDELKLFCIIDINGSLLRCIQEMHSAE